MKIVGLSGYARSGKDEAARVLVEEYGFVRVAFADKLREMLYQLNPIVAFDRGHTGRESVRIAGELWSPTFLQDVIDTYGWDRYKETAYGPEIRRLLQRLGTEAGRLTLWDSIWIDAALTGLPEDANVVVTDVRFPNEADAIRERGGEIVRVYRAGVGPANSHPSETSLDNYDFDYHVFNNGSLDEYYDSIRSLFNERKK